MFELGKVYPWYTMKSKTEFIVNNLHAKNVV